MVGANMREKGKWEAARRKGVTRLLVFGCVGLRHLFDFPPVEQQAGHVV